MRLGVSADATRSILPSVISSENAHSQRYIQREKGLYTARIGRQKVLQRYIQRES